MRFCLIFLLNAFFERFLKDKGISFHNLAPILEKELAYKWQSGMFYVEIVGLRGSSVILMDTRDIFK